MTFHFLNVPTYSWLQTQDHEFKAYSARPGPTYTACLQAILQLEGLFGNGPGGTQKAEEQRRGMLAFLHGPGAGEGMTVRQMNLNRPCGKPGL